MKDVQNHPTKNRRAEIPHGGSNQNHYLLGQFAPKRFLFLRGAYGRKRQNPH